MIHRLAVYAVAVAGSAAAFGVLARDLGQYAQATPEMRYWFGNLQNKAGYVCCSDADGYDAQWDTEGDHYRVFGRDGWVVVPDEAVVAGPNKAQVAKVWWGVKDNKRIVRCFMPGVEG